MGKSKRIRTSKECAQCKAPQSEMFRVKVSGQQNWLLLCKACQGKAKLQPDYQYGGTWKQKKRN